MFLGNQIERVFYKSGDWRSIFMSAVFANDRIYVFMNAVLIGRDGF